MAARQSRSERRSHYDDHTRITLSEDDMDVSELRHESIEGKLNALIMLAIANVAAFGGATLLLALNIVRGG